MINALALTALVVMSATQAPPKPDKPVTPPVRPVPSRPNAELQELRQMVRKLAARVELLEKQLKARSNQNPFGFPMPGQMAPPQAFGFQNPQGPGMPQHFGQMWRQFNMQPNQGQRMRMFTMPPVQFQFQQQGQNQAPQLRQRLDQRLRFLGREGNGSPTVMFKEDGSYQVMLNGKQLASGKLEPKESRNVSVTVENGNYKVTINGKVVTEGKVDQVQTGPKPR